ncbi:MAG: Prolipoprotein diacylglyceryl transferase [Paracidovorax wautersii]|uniref:Phosphatidylglycerol--prolipoprotein diacylglyceryl transferase n=1 Tax=Paracidovorax wautersii TaxID=1177982 RepID=A0A7V8FMC2_9BURK|nr:MAG: Prolipoprotein diacylglyceryl transferase [Paracidovorax wautersii]
MLIHPQFDPIAIQIGPLAVHWYGLMYLVAFVLFVVFGTLRTRQPHYAALGWQRRDIEDMLFWGVLGVVIGGRLGFCLFYQPAYYAEHPLEVLYVWRGGMSFHGGMLGVIVAMILFARVRRKPWLEVTDLIAPCVPLGLAAGRLGNFINGELWGRFADPSLPWAMVFPQSGSMLPRHPSQLYQALLEGLTLFLLLWLYARKPRHLGEVSAAFLVGYGTFRFIAEYFREPDSYLGLLAFNMSMGQWLCLPMILAGAALWGWSRRRALGGQR